MIALGKDALRVSLEVGRALAAFTYDDARRPGLSVGFDDGDLCATDGQSAVRFRRLMLEWESPAPKSLNHRSWRIDYVQAQLTAAMKAKTPVRLDWASLQPSGTFPRLSQVEPAAQLPKKLEPVQLGAPLLSRLELVAKACVKKPLPGKRWVLPGVDLAGLGGERDPTRWEIGVHSHLEVEHEAVVTIMPMRRRAS